MGESILPAWEQLPDIPLYMDQVLYVVNGALNRLEPWAEPAATAATVNSYVKAKLLPAPVKKKYGRPQLSRLVMIYALKRVLSMSETGLVLQELHRGREDGEAYALFLSALGQGMAGESISAPPLIAGAVSACCGKLAVERLIAEGKRQ